MMPYRVFVWGLYFVLPISGVPASMCPDNCRCDVNQMLVDCADSGLQYVPVGEIPIETRTLTLDGNLIQAIDAGSLSRLGPWLRKLSLADNHLERIANDSLSSLGRLRYLDLSGNQLAEVPGDALAGLSSLRKLDLSQNNLRYLQANDFPELSTLQELYMDANSIQSLQPGTFTNLPSLRKLTLADNLLGLDLVGCFTNTAVEELDLSSNHIPLISQVREWFALNGSLNLRSLFLANNDIQFLPRDVFLELGGLEVLDLEGNGLNAIADYNFKRLEGLRELKIDNNGIADIHEESFRTTVNLQVLTLDYNQLISFPQSLFTSTRSLTVLSAASNGLMDITAIMENGIFEEMRELILTSNMIADLPSGGFSTLPALTTLKLGDNHLQRVPDIQSLASLQVLDLSNNRITRIDADTFKQNQELQEIYLAGNRLTALDYAMFSNLHSLHILTVDGNPWWCDCRLEWMQDLMWSADQPPWAEHFASGVVCASPPEQEGESLEFVSLSALHQQCPDLHIGVFLPIAISVWLFILAFILARVCVRKYLMARKFKKRSRSNLNYSKRWNRRRKNAIIGRVPHRPYVPKNYKLSYRLMTFPLTRRDHSYQEINLAEDYKSPTVRNRAFSVTSV